MSVDVPVGFSQFEMELSDPCLVSCFFPATVETIHETFDFKTGTTETLGHKLDIVNPNGLLNITKGSHMKICSGYYLRNKDSLVLYSGCAQDTGQLSITTCEGTGGALPYGSMTANGGAARPSKISVMPGAALVLEDSSVTSISNNSEIHVWGTLVIKAGAKLYMGDGRSCSKATLMVYPGAYVLIDDDAYLEFFKIVGDTQDRHIFFISKLPSGASAIVGVDPSIESLLTRDSIIDGSESPVEICDLNTVTPTHGISNHQWGFSNLLEPKAIVRIPADTLCKGECLQIDFNASLNDPIRMLEVCRIDTILGAAALSCFGSKRIEGYNLEAGYNESSKCYLSQANLQVFPLCTYLDSAGHWYKIDVKVANHCNQEDDTTLYLYITQKPQAAISLADTTGCPGFETVKVYNHSLVNAEKAIWHVNLVATGKYQDGDEDRFHYGGDWEVFNLHYGDSFTFPDFRWIGGFKYAVSLTQIGRCGDSESNWDTVEIQPGAIINASPATVYSEPLGPGALQLNGFVGSATSYSWTPTSYLSNANILNPVATPSDTITYVLSATKGNCEAFDTLFVKYNTMAYAGKSDTICAGEPVLLGPNYDAALFLAYQYYESPSAVWGEIESRVNSNPDYFDKLSLYFISSEGRNMLNSLNPYPAFLGTIDRDQFYEKSWFVTYFQIFHDNRNYNQALDLFRTAIDSDAVLAAYIANNPLFQLTPFKDFLEGYNSDIQSGTASQMDISWEKYTNDLSGWEGLVNWENQTKIWDSVYSSSMYKVTVIDNANSKVEFDQVYIYAHQSISPAFNVQYQTDSTLYFSNQSSPIQYSTYYHWDFGDGDTSNEINPVHTFPLFDTSYVVKIIASNLCGSNSYTDTIRVDSMGLMGGWLTKTDDIKVRVGEEKPKSIFGKPEFNYLIYPNPFTKSLNYLYELKQEFKEGELVLTDAVGHKISTFKLHSETARISITTDELSAGIYTLTVFINNELQQVSRVVKY